MGIMNRFSNVIGRPGLRSSRTPPAIKSLAPGADGGALVVTEECLAALFINCGQVVDCRICGDPNSVLRFAFIEFTDDEGARDALSLSGTVLGEVYRLRLLGDHHHSTRIAFVEFVTVSCYSR